jgi:hypothetical protein
MIEIINPKNFITSIRETGYRSFAHAVAELVDNSLQAGATDIRINIGREKDRGVVSVIDNGSGMTIEALRTALQFGGSTRFDDRSGAGRFGMGLPTSSLCLSRRVDVYTWTEQGNLHVYLDLDELRKAEQITLQEPISTALPQFMPRTTHGTAVILSRCDRHDKLSESENISQTKFELRRIFRLALSRSQQLNLVVNEETLLAYDPLFLEHGHAGITATRYGPDLEYSVPIRGATSLIRITFSELPVMAWRNLSNAEKQELGISRGAGVSIIRGEREIAYGWYFLGSKRRENYDDWWRCAVRFSPELDELFGVNYTKQQITPRPDLDRLLTPDIQNIGRTLNARIRAEFVRTAKIKTSSTAKAVASQEKYLPDLVSSARTPLRALDYRIEVDAGIVDNTFYRSELNGSTVIVHLNQHHPFARLYLDAKKKNGNDISLIECLILAAVRAELAAKNDRARWWFRHFRSGWSDTLAAFLGN